MEKVRFTDKDFVYRVNIDNYSKELLIKEILSNIDIDINAKKSIPESPGIQSDILIRGGEVDKVSNYINNLIIEKVYGESPFPFAFKHWVYLSDSSNPYTFYHEHTNMPNFRTTGEWTWTLYVQMPDNLKNDDGKLLFQLSDESVHGILPIEGDLLVFPATMLHKPKLNKKSTRPRIVLAGIISKLDLDKSYTKKQKTAI